MLELKVVYASYVKKIDVGRFSVLKSFSVACSQCFVGTGILFLILKFTWCSYYSVSP